MKNEKDKTENSEEIKVKGGIILFRTEDDQIVSQPYENLGITDITMFAEYLNQLKDLEWKTRFEGDSDETESDE